MNPGDKEAEAKFKEASEAYAVQQMLKTKYDQYGRAFDGGAGGGGFDFSGMDFSDILLDIFGGSFGISLEMHIWCSWGGRNPNAP